MTRSSSPSADQTAVESGTRSDKRRVGPEPQCRQSREGDRRRDLQSLLHGFTISSLPARLMPVTFRSYMPSAKAGGAWNVPALVARTR